MYLGTQHSYMDCILQTSFLHPLFKIHLDNLMSYISGLSSRVPSRRTSSFWSSLTMRTSLNCSVDQTMLRSSSKSIKTKSKLMNSYFTMYSNPPIWIKSSSPLWDLVIMYVLWVMETRKPSIHAVMCSYSDMRQ